MDASNGHADSDKTQPIPVGHPEVALVFDGRIIKPRNFKLDLEQQPSSLMQLFKQAKRRTRLARFLQFFGLRRLYKPQFKLEDTQPIPPYTPDVTATSDATTQRYGRVGRTDAGIKLIGTDGMVMMTGAEWREYIGLPPSIFDGPNAVRKFFDDHTIKPNDQS